MVVGSLGVGSLRLLSLAASEERGHLKENPFWQVDFTLKLRCDFSDTGCDFLRPKPLESSDFCMINSSQMRSVPDL